MSKQFHGLCLSFLLSEIRGLHDMISQGWGVGRATGRGRGHGCVHTGSSRCSGLSGAGLQVQTSQQHTAGTRAGARKEMWEKGQLRRTQQQVTESDSLRRALLSSGWFTHSLLVGAGGLAILSSLNCSSFTAVPGWLCFSSLSLSCHLWPFQHVTVALGETGDSRGWSRLG